MTESQQELQPQLLRATYRKLILDFSGISVVMAGPVVYLSPAISARQMNMMYHPSPLRSGYALRSSGVAYYSELGINPQSSSYARACAQMRCIVENQACRGHSHIEAVTVGELAGFVTLTANILEPPAARRKIVDVVLRFLNLPEAVFGQFLISAFNYEHGITALDRPDAPTRWPDPYINLAAFKAAVFPAGWNGRQADADPPPCTFPTSPAVVNLDDRILNICLNVIIFFGAEHSIQYPYYWHNSRI